VWTKSYEDNIRSMSHPMQGGFAHFFYSALGGLQPLASHPGFERFVLRPELTTEVEFAKIDYESVRGTIRSDWRVSDGEFRWQIVAPPNSMVEAMLPSANIEGVELNGQPVTPGRIELRATAEGPRATIELGSGAWVLTQPMASMSAAERN
jgi:alpha-L-rhamnosidase